MQLIINLSKIVILAFLTCCLIVAWNESPPHLIVDLSTPHEMKKINELSVIKKIETIETIKTTSKPADSIWIHMRQHFKLNTKIPSAQVEKEIRLLLAEQDKLYKILQAAQPYIYFIYHQIELLDLPGEIALIPVIESEFNPNDYSNKGAIGLWQLMSGTARDLGVKIKSGYDGRRNVIDSTKAALAYFSELGSYFNGNWYLAIAAYNSGQVKVKSAMRKAHSNDFWDLPLPKETKHYVPRLLAVAAIIKEPEKYGIHLPNINHEPYFSEIKMKKPVNLAQIAKLSGTNPKILRSLNPDYRKGEAPQKNATTLLIPVNKASIVKHHYGINK